MCSSTCILYSFKVFMYSFKAPTSIMNEVSIIVVISCELSQFKIAIQSRKEGKTYRTPNKLTTENNVITFAK